MKEQEKDNQTVNNSDILFIYDAKMCNPNGDPDEENKPRMDYETGRNLVSDVRLKRYIRDYLLGQKNDDGTPKHDIWVSKVENDTVSAKKRYAGLVTQFNIEMKDKAGKEKTKYEDMKPIEPTDQFKQWLLGRLADVRMFGATIPIAEGDRGRGGGSLTYTGPAQFSWGVSLHPVEIVPSSGITSTFAGRERSTESEERQEYGAMGKDWRVFYSLIAFQGIVSGHRAAKTALKPTDITLLDQALLKAIPHEATTRSKLGQTPRLYLRVEYNDQETTLGDLRRFVEFPPHQEKTPIRDVTDCKLNVSKLIEALKKNAERIGVLHYWRDPELSVEPDIANDEALKSKLPRPGPKQG